MAKKKTTRKKAVQKKEMPTLEIQPSALNIVMEPVDSLVLDPQNARAHGDADVDKVIASLKKFGQYHALIVNTNGRRVAIGNGRLIAARRMGWKEIAVQWRDMTEAEHIELSITDNHTGDQSDWDQAMLQLNLPKIKVSDEQLYNDLMLSELVAEDEPITSTDEVPAQMDRAEELLKKWKVVPGQLWEIPSQWYKCPGCGKMHRKQS